MAMTQRRSRNLFNFHLDHYTGHELRGIIAALRKRGIVIDARGPGVAHLYVTADLAGGVLCKRTHKGWSFKRFGTVTNGAIREIHAFVTDPAPALAAKPAPGISSTRVQKPKRSAAAA